MSCGIIDVTKTPRLQIRKQNTDIKTSHRDESKTHICEVNKNERETDTITTMLIRPNLVYTQSEMKTKKKLQTEATQSCESLQREQS